MKNVLIILVTTLVLISCKKEILKDASPTSLLSKIEIQLKDSLSTDDYLGLDFGKTVITDVEQSRVLLLRIPFKTKSIERDFILLKIESNGNFSLGKIINLSSSDNGITQKSKQAFNGKVTIYKLNRVVQTESFIRDGFVESFHPDNNHIMFKEMVVEIPLMPEVIMVSKVPSGRESWTYNDFYNLQSFLFGGESNISGIGSTGNSGAVSYYSSSQPHGSSGSNNNGGGSSTPIVDDPISIEYETGESLPGIDIQKYLKCFSYIPDQGAVCTIKLFSDLPVDDDPNAFVNWRLGSPGHTFIQLTKVNGTKSVQQNIGFYPEQGWKSVLTNTPVTGKFVDNAKHELNASFSMTLSAAGFQRTLDHVKYLANFIKYDLDDYNCTDFALDVFNYEREANPLIIPKYYIPGTNPRNGTSTPQGLYKQLIYMKAQVNSEANNIIIPGSNTLAGNSDGPCN